MATRAQNYAVGIGGGAAAGAASGAAIGGPWGALIGGVVGAGGGAVGAAVKSNAEDDERQRLQEEQKRRRKRMLIDLLQRQAASYGQNTEDISATLGANDERRAEAQETRGLMQSQELSPQAFLPIAQQGLQAANTAYTKANAPPQGAPVSGQSMQAMPQQGQAPQQAYQAYQLQRPRWLEDEY